jgi:hypothetical protein
MKVSMQMTLEGMLRALKTKRRSIVNKVEVKDAKATKKRPRVVKERPDERGRS